MHQIQPVIEHYEDIKIEHVHKIWIGVGRIKSEFIRILRLPSHKRTQTVWINKMIEIDDKITESYYNRLAEQAKEDDGIGQLLIDNEMLVAQLKNHALTHLVQHAKNMMEQGQTMSTKESLLMLKALEMYGNKGATKEPDQINKTTSLARQLLGLDDASGSGYGAIQSANQEAAKLRLPSSSIVSSN